MLIELTKSHYGSVSQSIPEVKLHNMYISENPLSPTGFSYITRPVVTDFIDFGGDNIRGVFYQQGFSDDLLLVVAGPTLYSVTETGFKTPLGSIAGTGICQFASTIYGVGIVSGGFLYLYDGVTFTPVAIPDDQTPSTITSLNNYFIIAIKGSNKFYWIAPGDTTIDDLSFASAEANPDFIVAIKAISDELWIIGTQTSEVWAISGDPDAPFNRISGRVFNKGCVSEESVAAASFKSLPCLIWVSRNKEVILAQGAPDKISNDFVEEVLRGSTYYRGWFFQRQRNDFYVLSTNLMTLVYDIGNATWYKWSTINQDTWKVSAGAQKDSLLYGADFLESPKLYKVSEGYLDGDKEWLVAEVTGFVPHNKRDALSCGTVDLYLNAGLGSSYLVDPVIEARWSDDQGANWSTYAQTTIGARGGTDNRTQFRSLGLIRTPGRRFEFRFSLAEQFRLDYALMNNEG